jgi:hypothetical protein
MATMGRRAVTGLGLAAAPLLLGCPSLANIGVGDGDARSADASQDVAAIRDTSAMDEAPPCTSDAASDPKNCGTCGHDCQGGSCRAGVCQAYAIVTGNEGPYGVAVHNGVVYFTSIDDTVAMCTANTCTDTLTQLTSGQPIPRHITTDDTNVYWANLGLPGDGGVITGSIATCGLSGCPGGSATVLASPEKSPFDLTVSASIVYWTVEYGHAVLSCPAGGCDGMPTTLSAPATLLSGVAVDATSIYWAEPSLGNVIQCPLSGCTSPVPFATGQDNPLEVDVTNGTLFWSTSDAIMSCPTSGCAGSPTVFASNQPGAFALTHDAHNLYWVLEEKEGKVLSCPLSNCKTPIVLADMQAVPTAIAVDDTAVYWANSGAGTIMRVMK